MTLFQKLKKIFNKKSEINSQINYKSSTSKYSMTADCTMELSSSTNIKKKEIEAHLKNLVKKYINESEKLIQYMKLKGAKVYKINNAEKILSFINEEAGFISPLSGFKAMFLNTILSGKLQLKFSTDEMLVFDSKETEIYTVIRAIHKYYGFKNNLPGFDKKSQDLFKKLYNSRNKKYAKAQMQTLNLQDVLMARDALARDLESIDFTIQLSIEHERSKKVLNQMISEKSTKV